MKKNLLITVLFLIPLFSYAQQQVKDAPAPIAPYSQFRLANGTLYLSGQIGINPKTKKAEIDYDFCKGCGICASVCPLKAIKMVEEEK